jgi:ATP-binding cassette subfamily B protein
MWRMLCFLKKVRWIAAIASLVVIAKIAVEVLCVYFLSPAVTMVVHQLNTDGNLGFWNWIMANSESAVALRKILLVMALSQIGLGVMIYLRSVWDTKLSMNAVFHIRSAIYDRLQRASLSFFDDMTTGQVINRALGDLQAVRSFVNLSVLATLDIIVSLAFYLGLLYMRSPLLMLAALAPVPFWLLTILRYGKKMQPICREQQTITDEMMMTLTENLTGVHVVRSFGTEKAEIKKYSRLSSQWMDRLKNSLYVQAFFMPILRLIGSTAHIGLFVLSAWLILNQKMEVGDLMLLGAAMAALLGKLQQIRNMVEAYQKAIASSRRLFEILDLPITVGAAAPKKEKLKFKDGEIQFHDVNFSYGSVRALTGASVTIPGGKVTALTGPAGSGKSTLAGLIPRFYDPEQGKVTIDGVDLKDVDLHDLRHHIGIVFQETFLFSATVRENIIYGRKDVSEEMMRKAARAAFADEFIETLPNGYNTVIGAKGVGLSGGQCQRLALARALVYDPKILILDDATAALDTHTELTIHQRLDPLFKGRTVLLIAHRLSSVLWADHVLVMENGRVTQAGTHHELVESEGHYQEIVRLQMMTELGQEIEESHDNHHSPLQETAG